MIELIEKTRSSAFGFFDLRPIMWIVRSQAPAYFLYDTHWTARAALDGFNAIVKADGHSEWLMDADAALTPPAQHQGGDLARMIDVSDAVAEPRQKIDLSAPPFPSYVATSGEPGETIMIIGESFTEAYFAPMLLKHVGRVVWQHHWLCRFDWKLIDSFRPDEVWWMPTERQFLCIPNVRPEGFPGRQQAVSR